jgi:transcriptional regulator with XRE-family HTH domain
MAAPPESSPAIFAANVARIREGKGLTQEQLGWAAGLHQTAVTRIESGERMPTLPTILKIAEGLEVPPADLFAGID